MGGFNKSVKRVLEAITGYEIERFGHNAFTLVKKAYCADAWFSYSIQLRSIIEKWGIDLVIDAGANEGQFARALRSFYQGEILSFEPVSSTYSKLAIFANNDPAWRVFKMALGNQDNTLAINVSNHTVFSSFLRSNNYCQEYFGKDSAVIKSEDVTVRKLDRLLEELVPDIDTRRIFLKMDTQGYDTEVFRGIGRNIANVMALQSELSLVPVYENMPHWTECISAYENAGFCVAGMFPVSCDSGKIIEYDCLLVKKTDERTGSKITL